MEKLQKKKWLFLAAAVVFLAAWAALGITGRSSRPEAVAQKFRKAYLKLDTKRMVKCYAPELREKKRESLKELAEIPGSVSGYAGKGKVIAGDVVYGENKNTAVVTCADIPKDDNGAWAGVTFNKLTLVKVGNKWYIGE